MRKRAVVAAGIAALVGGTVFVSMAHGAPSGPVVDPSNFVAHVTNPYFPLKPGTVWIYKGVKDGKQQTDRVEVTHRTKTIEGVHATIVHDVATHQGKVLEATFDYYAQDKQGAVWYFGEDTKEFLPNGTVSAEGSWLSGRNNARPGVIMEADPHVSDGYRQEYLKGQAEDQAWVVMIGARFHVGYGTFSPAIKSFEWSRLEPNVIDEKDYGRGVGIIREISRTGARETAFLVRVHRP